VLDAAIRIVLEGGVSTLTMQGLAQETGISIGGLYRYYPSKDAVLAALTVRALGELAQAQSADLAKADAFLRRHHAARPVGPAARALFRALVAVTTYSRAVHRQPQHFALLSSFLSQPVPVLPDSFAREIEMQVTPLVSVIARELEEAVRTEALHPGVALQRTFVLWGLMQGILQFKNRDRFMPENLHARVLLSEAFLAALQGWGASQRMARSVMKDLAELDRSLTRSA